MDYLARVGVILLSVIVLAISAASQARPLPGNDVQQLYQELLPQIEQIPIFDHHAHPGYADDPDVDAMAAPPGSAALRERETNPELVAAAKALWGYPYDDLSPEHEKWLIQKKAEMKKQLGQQYFDQILDKLNIEQGVANRAMMADYLDPKRFVWVFFMDSFMWPFNNQLETARNADEQVYIPLQEKMLHRWMQQEGISKLPPKFSDYLEFINRTVEDNQKKGGIAMKFEVAYFRPLTFSDPARAEAEAIYKKYIGGAVPNEREYRTFQDFIFRYLVVLGGKLQLPVHIHSAVGIGDYFNLSQSNITHLEDIVRDPRYSNTIFVMLHGGYPYDRQAIWFGSAKNVYLDTSETEILLYPSEFKKMLKQWLETFPEKVTFGSDCFPYNEALGAEESYWLGVESSRTALAAALAEMISENEITRAQALQLAHGYLHDNAVGIYHGKVH